jgi:hypothetical protein
MDPIIRILLFSSVTFKTPTKTNLKKSFSAYYFLKVHLHHFSKKKVKKKSQNSKNQAFSYYICLMIEGFGSGSGSIPLTDGSGAGSRRPKNMWIRSGFGSSTLLSNKTEKENISPDGGRHHLADGGMSFCLLVTGWLLLFAGWGLTRLLD